MMQVRCVISLGMHLTLLYGQLDFSFFNNQAYGIDITKEISKANARFPYIN